MIQEERRVLLIAEDDPDDCILLEDAFKVAEPDYQLHFAEHGERVLEFLRTPGQRLPCAIVLDLNMPRMDGRRVLEELSKDALLCKVPVIILTTSHAASDMELAIQYGCCGFLTKPSSFKELVRLTHTIVECCNPADSSHD